MKKTIIAAIVSASLALAAPPSFAARALAVLSTQTSNIYAMEISSVLCIDTREPVGILPRK